MSQASSALTGSKYLAALAGGRHLVATLLELEPEFYARHLTEAGSWPEAIQAWRSAAHRAARRSAAEEAVALFRRAIELVTRVEGATERDAIELDLRIGFGSALMAVHGFGAEAVGAAFARAHELSVRVSMKAEVLLELGRRSEAASLLDSLLRRVEGGPTTKSELLRLRGIQSARGCNRPGRDVFSSIPRACKSPRRAPVSTSRSFRLGAALPGSRRVGQGARRS